MTPSIGLILPIDEAGGPVTRLEQLEEDLGIETIVRARDASVHLYDANGILFGSWSEVTLVKDLRLEQPKANEAAKPPMSASDNLRQAKAWLNEIGLANNADDPDVETPETYLAQGIDAFSILIDQVDEQLDQIAPVRSRSENLMQSNFAFESVIPSKSPKTKRAGATERRSRPRFGRQKRRTRRPTNATPTSARRSPRGGKPAWTRVWTASCSIAPCATLTPMGPTRSRETTWRRPA
jgi:hypothetical protein